MGNSEQVRRNENGTSNKVLAVRPNQHAVNNLILWHSSGDGQFKALLLCNSLKLENSRLQ